MIQFDQIPSSIRKPGKYFEFNTRLAVRTLPQNRQKLLIIGPLLASAQVAEKIPYVAVDWYSPEFTAAIYAAIGSIRRR